MWSLGEEDMWLNLFYGDLFHKFWKSAYCIYICCVSASFSLFISQEWGFIFPILILVTSQWNLANRESSSQITFGKTNSWFNCFLFFFLKDHDWSLISSWLILIIAIKICKFIAPLDKMRKREVLIIWLLQEQYIMFCLDILRKGSCISLFSCGIKAYSSYYPISFILIHPLHHHRKKIIITYHYHLRCIVPSKWGPFKKFNLGDIKF